MVETDSIILVIKHKILGQKNLLAKCLLEFESTQEDQNCNNGPLK